MSMHHDTQRLVILRTHYWDASIERFAARLEASGEDVCIAVDETHGPTAIPQDVGWPVVALTPSLIHDLGLLQTDDVSWRCGDYALYAVRQRFPDKANYWLIEPDDYFNMDDIGSFFRFFDAFPEVGLLCAYGRRAEPNWFWAGAMRRFETDVHRCLFSIVRLSASALDRLLDRRRAMSDAIRTEGAVIDKQSWPNDEAFVATVCATDGLGMRDLNSFGHVFYSTETLSFNNPMSLNFLSNHRKDGCVYHPVLSGKHFERKARDLFVNATRGRAHDLLVFNRVFQRHFASEMGAAAASRFARDVRTAWRAKGRHLLSFLALSEARHLRRRWLGRRPS